MSEPRTIYGRALGDLVERLGNYPTVELNPEQRAGVVFFEMASTPCLWPLDDVLYELLLTTAGFDLSDADHLHGALWATALLVAGDPTYDGICCGHGDTPSLLCELDADIDLDECYCKVMDMARDGMFDAIYDYRRRRCAEYGIDPDEGHDELPSAA